MNIPIRFAVVGCGMLARMQHIPNIIRSSRMKLEVSCDLSDENLAVCKKLDPETRLFKDYSAAISDPCVDAICLATTEKLRLPVIELAAHAGKPIYVEKPLARTLQEMYAIQKIIHQTGVPFCIGHNRRSAPAMLEAHHLFREHMVAPKVCPWRFDREGARRPKLPGEHTPGMAVRINDDWHSWKGWVFDKEQAPHGPMLFEMTHFTDLCNWFIADVPEHVVAMQTDPFNHGVVIRYQSGAMASIFMCSNGTFGYPKELYEMMGNGGIIAVDHMVEVRSAGIADAPSRRIYPLLNDRHPHIGLEGGIAGWLAKKQAACNEATERKDPSAQFTAEPNKGHAAHMERFVDEILGIGPKVCGVDDAILASRVAFCAIQAAASGTKVALADL